ncbi:MAG: hypothetical protein K2N51_00330 [Lachnospiraceae bacterium]|nr:hypothetical protein [Lachnospiraceae bacterium]
MHIKSLSGFVLEEFSRNLKQLMLEFILLVSSFMLIGLVSFYGDGITYSKDSVEEIINGDISQTGELFIEIPLWNPLMKESRGVMDEINDLEGVKAIGEQIIAGFEASGFEQLIEIQQQHRNYGISYGEEYTNSLEALFISDTLMDLCDLKTVERIEGSGNTECEFYLGSNFSDIPVGTVFTKKLGEETYTYEVVGILEKNSYWIDPDIYTETEAGNINAKICLDNLIVSVDKKTVSATGWTVLLEDGASWEELTTEIMKLEDKYDVNFRITKLESTLYDKNLSSKETTEYTRQFFPVLVFSVIIIILCIQITNMLKRKKEYGILFSNGVSVFEICKIWMMAFFCKIVISLVFAIALFTGLVYVSGITPQLLEQGFIVFQHYTVWKIVTLSVALYLIISIIPVIILSKMKPAQMVKGE